MSHYSITVPDNKEALRRAAEFFAALCGCLVEPKPQRADYLREGIGQFLSRESVDTTPVPPEAMQQIQGVIAPPKPSIPGIGQSLSRPSPDPAAIFGAPPQPPTDATTVSNQVKVDGVWQDAPSGVNAIFKAVTSPTAIELADGIPWDERIHAGSKTKMKAAPHGWKLKKQPGEYATKDLWLAYVAEVEAELRNVMVVSPPPVAMACGKVLGSAPPVPPTTTPTIPADIPPAPTGQPAMTYAGLTEAITTAGIMPAAVQAALVGVGLTSYPTLATQPELIPQVAKLLGLGA
jgi:hypothetical protein